MPAADAAAVPLRTDLAAALDQLSQRLVDDQPPADLDVDGALRFVVLAVPHAGHAALTRIRRDAPSEMVAATSSASARIAQFAAEANEGPCRVTAFDGRIRRVDDIATDERWPAFAALVVEQTPIRSMLSLPVRLDDEERATLTVFADATGAFDEIDLCLAASCVGLVVVAARSAERAESVAHLEMALESSRRIGAAMGIVMSRELLTFEQAFDRLRSTSQRMHRKLRDIAAEIVDTGQLPT